MLDASDWGMGASRGIQPRWGWEWWRLVTQGGALRAYPGLCHETPLRSWERAITSSTPRSLRQLCRRLSIISGNQVLLRSPDATIFSILGYGFTASVPQNGSRLTGATLINLDRPSEARSHSQQDAG